MIWKLGFGDSGIGVLGLGEEFRFLCFVFCVLCFVFGVWGLGFGVLSFRFWVLEFDSGHRRLPSYVGMTVAGCTITIIIIITITITITINITITITIIITIVAGNVLAFAYISGASMNPARWFVV